ncbi:MAG: trypsin-like peptidase domain-containing protein [Phycisphaerae bacterium]|nr:trypsin-like peptidase domain-containing protein [Phycisphaerae bacterium]
MNSITAFALLAPLLTLALTLTVPPIAVHQSAETPTTSSFAAVLNAQDQARRALYDTIGPSLLSVTSYVKVPEGADREGRWAVADESPYMGYARHLVASGILIDNDGTVLCCRTPLTVENDTFAAIVDVETSAGARFDAELIASEPTINLAVIKIKLQSGQTLGDLRPARIGTTRSIELGDTVFAAADPFGASRTFAPGVVMALPTAACYQSDLTGSFIHCSMSIAPGAVGGALINPSGEVIGMLVPPPSLDPLARPEPHGYDTFVMQIETAIGVGEALKTKRTNDSPWLGFSVLSQDELRSSLRDAAKFAAITRPEHGLYINDLYDPSPASKAGVQPGDFVVAVSGRPIVSVVDFQQALYYFSGTNVPIRFFRDGKERTLVMQIERRPPAANRE